MAKTPLSTASLLVLDHLRRANGKEVLKLAIKELVARGAFETGEAEPADSGRRRRRKAKTPRVVLHPTGQAHGGDALLGWMDQKIRGSESMVVNGRVAYALDDVALRLAKGDPKIQLSVVDRVLADLEGRKLVHGEKRKRLGLFPTTRWTRTSSGEELIGTAERGRYRRTGGDSGLMLWTDTYGGHGDHHDRDDQVTDAALLVSGLDTSTDVGSDGGIDTGFDGGIAAGLDAGLDSGLDAGFDSAFDLSFDGAFDTAFDSAFDTGFSDGGGDAGGGGDSGGGDGGGGGGD